MQTRIEEFERRDARVIAISVDPPERSREIVEAYGLEFPVLSDPELRAIDAYGVRHEGGYYVDGTDIARPAAFIIDREGRIAWRELTDNWRVRVRPERLLEALDAIP